MGSAAGEEFVSLKEEKEEEGLYFVYIMCVDVTKSNKIIRPCVSKLFRLYYCYPKGITF